MLHTIWRIESIIAWASVMRNEKAIWESRQQKVGKLDDLEKRRLDYVNSEWDRLKEHLPAMESELKKLRDDLKLGKMEVPQAVLERLQGQREIPMSDIVNTNLPVTDLQEIPMEDITSTHG
jgi:hypothetical protein